MTSPTPEPAPFDTYAANYDAALSQGLAATGEDKLYFAQGRVLWLQRSLLRLEVSPRRILDFGCGTGSATPLLLATFPGSTVTGVDPSVESVALARKQHGSAKANFFPVRECPAAAQFDLVFCNGVFHHIQPPGRQEALTYILDSLRTRGLLAFWENNPWNPGTRYVMRRIPFDRDAIPIPSPDAVRMLKSVGFVVLQNDFHFYFPHFLCWLRFLERFLIHFPFGGQYLVLCQKP